MASLYRDDDDGIIYNGSVYTAAARIGYKSVEMGVGFAAAATATISAAVHSPLPRDARSKTLGRHGGARIQK